MGKLKEILESKQAPFGVVVGTINPVTQAPPRRTPKRLRVESDEAVNAKVTNLVREVRNQHVERYKRVGVKRDALEAIEHNRSMNDAGHKVKFIAGFSPEHAAHLRRELGPHWMRDKAAIRHMAQRDPAVAERQRHLEYAADAAR